VISLGLFIFGEKRMNKFVRLILPSAVCGLLVGCAPQDSLFPLFLKSQQGFKEGLLGEWMVQGG